MLYNIAVVPIRYINQLTPNGSEAQCEADEEKPLKCREIRIDFYTKTVSRVIEEI